jgi:dolichol-phosphate mannosyltransferase
MIGVIIPVYGDSDSLCWVLSRFSQTSVSTICLVVDVPLKAVMEKVRDSAKQSGVAVRIIKNRSRAGIGYAIKQGLRYLTDSGHELVVVMAGNGKDDPAQINRLVEPILRSECDYAQGSRYLSGGERNRMPLSRILFNRIYPVIWTLLTQRRCTDVTNGFRCYRLDILKDRRIDLDQDWLNGYALEYYLHFKVLTLGYRVKEVAVSNIYPFGNRGGYSKIQPLRDWWQIVSPPVLLLLGARE